MNITGFLAFVGLIIAAYSILNKHDRLKIRIRLSALDKVVSVFLLIIIFFALIISDYFRDYVEEISILNFRFKLHFIISASAYLALLFLNLYIFMKIWKTRLKRRKIILYKNLIEAVLNRKEYTTIVELMKPEAIRIVKYSERASLFNSIKDKLLDFFKTKSTFEIPLEAIESIERLTELEEFNEDFEEKELSKNKIKLFFKKFSKNVRHYIGKFIRIFFHRSRDKYQETAQDLLNLLLTNHEFISKLIEYRPELGLKIFEHEFHNYHEYADIFFYEFMKNNRSILYYEIRNNQNIDGYRHRYFLTEENKLLNFLFKDCRVAKRLVVYRGISNFINDYLIDLNNQKNDSYNYSYGNFNEAKWSSPIYVGIRLFDIMISETMHQGINWLHPIYYFRILTEKILRNFKTINKVWKEPHEWNSKYSYLLSEIILTLENMIYWIKYEETNFPTKLKREDHKLESGNVIKACIIYLINVLELIAKSDNVPYKFKLEQADIVLRLLFELRISIFEETIQYSKVLFNCIKDRIAKSKRFNKNFLKLIKASYNSFDKISYAYKTGKAGDSVKDLNKEIEEYLTAFSEGND